MHMDKTCTKCSVKKPIDAFRSRTNAKDGHRPECKDCQDNQNLAYRATLKGQVSQLLFNAKGDSKKRTGEAKTFELARKDIMNLWNNQQGRCYYSNIPLTFRGSWKISLERLNPKFGYSVENVALICLELQNRCNWSKDKIIDMTNILNQNIIENLDVNFDKNEVRKKQEVVEKQVINDIEHCKCNTCKCFKTKEQFRQNHICIPCDKQQQKDWRETPRGSLLELVGSAKSSSKTRAKAGHNKHDVDMDIDFDFLVELFNKQKGLCAYSGLPLQFGDTNEKNWITSLERIDTCRGYMKDNVCLICLEFNATDHSVLKSDMSESTGWTKEKFQVFLTSLQQATV
jgi:hypothetical protein